jgi:Zn-dependent M28 family amino/carboxypeptidase
MRLHRLAAIALFVAAAIATAAAFVQKPVTTQSALVAFHKDVDPAIDAMWAAYDRTAAMDHVKFISQYWRLAGNPGYNATVDRIQARLKTAGIATRVEEYPTGPAWDHSAASLAVIRTGAPDEVVLSREKDRLTLCINSFSTPEGGITGRLVDVGRGTEQDYAGKELKGAIVLGDTDAGALFRRAVVTGGAAGVVSTTLPGYLNVDVPGAATATPRDQWDILQWTSVPYDEARKSFGFKASPRAAATLRKRLADAGPNTAVMLKVRISASFGTGPARTLVAEIPGTVAPAERIVLAAHIQEPGANDNASGVATLAEMAVAMSTAIKQKKIAAPLRTITFLFLNEISGSRRWIQDHPAEAQQVKYMFSLDMTGEDVSKTGGTFLVERYPDPGAVWERPWDPHSEWGKGNVRAESLKGDLLNDAHLTVLRRVAGKSKWVVSTNPYEGGSDHTVFGTAGVPSVLDWHFTDRYYHTNFDTPDKTSPDEMRNVGVGAGATAWLLASASEKVALNLAGVVAIEGEKRVRIEQTEGAKLAAEAPDRAAAASREATIVAAWKKWYGEAVQSATRLVIGPVPADLEKTLAELSKPFITAPVAEALAEAGGPFVSDAPADALVAPFDPPQNPTPIFTCGTDEKLQELIPVRWGTVVLAGDGRLYRPCPIDPQFGTKHPPEHRELREAMVIDIAAGLLSASGQPADEPVQAGNRSVEVVQRGVQAVARLRRPLGGLVVATLRPNFYPACSAEARIVDNRRWQPGLLFTQMRNANADVRKEAAYGIVVKLTETEDELIKPALTELRACLDREKDPVVQAVLLEGWGVAKYSNDEQRAEAEAILVDQSRREPPTARMLGATKALEALIRLAPRRPVSDAARVRLRELALYGDRSPDGNVLHQRIRRMAMMALQAARDTDVPTLRAASDDGDWQVRRLVAARLNLNDPEQANIAVQYRDDPMLHVRYELVGAIGRLAQDFVPQGHRGVGAEHRLPILLHQPRPEGFGLGNCQPAHILRRRFARVNPLVDVHRLHLDDVIDELNAADFKMDMEKMQKELAESMKKFDMKKMQLDMEKTMREVDFQKIQKEIEQSMAKIDFTNIEKEMANAMKEFDAVKLQKELNESMSKIEWDKMKTEFDKVKDIDMKKMQLDMEKMQAELSKIGPEIEKSMEKAKIEIQKAKEEMKEYKKFVDGLEKDGLLNRKEGYTIKHKDGELTINGKKATDAVYDKYRSFLEKHKKFTIEKSDDDFNIDID